MILIQTVMSLKLSHTTVNVYNTYTACYNMWRILLL